jgi:hypothetical protein
MIEIDKNGHTAEVAAKIAAAKAAAAQRAATPKIDNTDALANSGLTVVHCNANAIYGTGNGYRAITIAYEQINRSHLRISTAVTHRTDTFTKKVGTKTALANFAKGNTVVIPLAKGADKGGIAQQLRGMFGFIPA